MGNKKKRGQANRGGGRAGGKAADNNGKPKSVEHIEEEEMIVLPGEDVECYRAILELLSNAGYHRARCITIPDYKKVIGGLIWAASRLNQCKDPPIYNSLTTCEFNERDSSISHNGTLGQDLLEFLLKTNNFPELKMQNLMGPNYVALKPVVEKVVEMLQEEKYTDRVLMEYFVHLKHVRENPTVATNSFREYITFPLFSNLDRSERFDKFDYSILCDIKMDGRLIMAEYMNYYKTAMRIYPDRRQLVPPFPYDENRTKLHQERYNEKKTLATLENCAAKLLDTETNEDVIAMRDRCIEIINELSVASQLAAWQSRLMLQGEEYRVLLVNSHQKRYQYNLVREQKFGIDNPQEFIENFGKKLIEARNVYDGLIQRLDHMKAKNGLLQENKTDEGIEKANEYRMKYCFSVHTTNELQRLIKTFTERFDSYKKAICKLDNQPAVLSAEAIRISEGTIPVEDIDQEIKDEMDKIEMYYEEIVNEMLKDKEECEVYRKIFSHIVADMKLVLGNLHTLSRHAKSRRVKLAKNYCEHFLFLENKNFAVKRKHAVGYRLLKATEVYERMVRLTIFCKRDQRLKYTQSERKSQDLDIDIFGTYHVTEDKEEPEAGPSPLCDEPIEAGYDDEGEALFQRLLANSRFLM
ncbi:unnamed protein product [Caenorhabditis sp. 36 PRJEB53466]|nr:unnamed protein product [Caenorhabditis sp. 36 PRJEB53466]